MIVTRYNIVNYITTIFVFYHKIIKSVPFIKGIFMVVNLLLAFLKISHLSLSLSSISPNITSQCLTIGT